MLETAHLSARVPHLNAHPNAHLNAHLKRAHSPIQSRDGNGAVRESRK